MKIILEFDLPKDKEEAKIAQNASNYLMALTDIHDKLREYCKYHSKEWACEFKKEFHAILEENGVEL
jgi:hypothetical protein